MCGEKDITALNANNWQGSPPHVRGKVTADTRLVSSHGITPAYAGKSKSAQGPADSREDHPRTCGEKIYSVRDNVAEQGSPPHVRGKVSQFVDLLCGDGITPAYAGKSARAAMLGNKV